MRLSTDVYHVALGYVINTNSDVVIQISQFSSKETQYYHLSRSLNAEANDPDLATLLSEDIHQISNLYTEAKGKKVRW